MVGPVPDRRCVMAGLAAMALLPGRSRAQGIVDLRWTDLIPEGQPAIPPGLQGLIDHDQAPLFSQQPESTGVRNDWNGQIVRLPGFIVPIETSGAGVTAFILVPFVGACVHVPPPPAHQLVFVTSPEPYESSGLFEAVHVTGMFGASATSTQLAEIGYALTAERIEPFS